MIVLAYLWILALVPLFVERTDREVQWHAKHGLVMTIAELGALVGYVVMLSVASLVGVRLGVVMVWVLVVGWIVVVSVHVAAIVIGTNGGRLNVPLVTRYVNER